MNERIIELAEKAGFVYNFDPVNWLKYEKFAELIVQECIDTISDCSIDYCTRPQIVSEIKEHFGVKE